MEPLGIQQFSTKKNTPLFQNDDNSEHGGDVINIRPTNRNILKTSANQEAAAMSIQGKKAPCTESDVALDGATCHYSKHASLISC